MARLFLIIDGYNLMHSAGLGRTSYGPGDLEQCRRRLVQQLAIRLDDTVAADAVVVFDAVQGLHGEPSPEEVSAPLKVRFSRGGLDADSEIELLLNSHSSPQRVLVISSDHRLHKAARRRKAKCLDSEDFWKLLESGDSVHVLRKRATRPDTGRDATLSREPVSSSDEPDYAQEFLNIDINEIKRSVRKEDR